MTVQLGNRTVHVWFQYPTCAEPWYIICHLRDDGILPAIQAHGRAACSVRDRYVRWKGRKIALRRAMENAGLGREDRRVIWQRFRQTHRYSIGKGLIAKRANERDEARSVARSLLARVQFETPYERHRFIDTHPWLKEPDLVGESAE